MRTKQTIRNFLEDEEGSLGIQLRNFFLSIFVILLGLSAFEYLYQMNNANQISQAMKSAVLSSVTDNYDEIYAGFKNGEAVSAEFKEASEQFEIKFDEGDIMEYLEGELQLVKEGTHYHRGSQYELYDFEVEQVSKPIYNPQASTQTFHVNVKITYKAPSNFLFKGVPFIKDVHATAKYIAKF